MIGESRFLVSGSADNMMKLWDVKTGKCLFTWEFPTAIKRVAFSDDDALIACITEQRMGYQGAVRVFAINRNGTGSEQEEEPLSMFHPIESKATVLTFGMTSEHIITGHESGKLTVYKTKTGDEVVSNKRAHRENVTDIQLSEDRSYFITSSKDKSAKLFESKTLDELKTYVTETPLNSAAIAPKRPYVRFYDFSECVSYVLQILLGGGQEAMNVTTTSLRQGKFETRFWHKVLEEEVGRVKGHFGPINTYVH